MAKEVIRESEVEEYFVNEVEKAEGETYKLKWLGIAGAPDRMVLMGWGRVLFVELKRPGKKPSALQERIHARLRRRGLVIEVIDTFEKVDRFVGKWK